MRPAQRYFLLFVTAFLFSVTAALAADGDYEVNGVTGTNASDVNGLYVFQNFGDYSKNNPSSGGVSGNTPIYLNANDYWLGHRGCVLEWIIISDNGQWQVCGTGTGHVLGSKSAGEYINSHWYPPVGSWGACTNATYVSLTNASVTKAAPPTPSTMSFSTAPNESGTNAITMVATQASDPSGVRYYFGFTGSPTGGSGGSDAAAGGQSNRTYTDDGLSPNHQYQYHVRARDAHNQWNNYSAAAAAYTAIEPPSGISFGSITNNSIQVRSTNTPPGLTRGGSGLIFYNTTASTNSGWQRNNDDWTSGSLSPNTSYGFRARARNGDGATTGYCTTVARSTLANVPGATSFSDVTQTSIRANWSANDNPSGTQYYCENTTLGTSSGWTTSTSWNSTALSCGSGYTFRVRARNGNSLTTGWRDLGMPSTQSCPGTLSVTPASGLDATGYVGGPFSHSTPYTLTNTGDLTINWTASATENWVSLSSPSGTLDGSESTTVTVSINSNANTLPAGGYNATVTFNANDSGTASRPISLSVQDHITLGHIDDFENDTSQNWFFGSDSGSSGSPPSMFTDAEAANTYIIVNADGSNMDGKLVIQNSNQWTGDWTDAGIKNVEADLINLGTQALEMRLAIVNVDAGGAITGGCASTIGVTVPPNSADWQHVVFPVDAGAFSCSLDADITGMLTDVAMLRLLHNTNPDHLSEDVVAQLGVDNIRAIPYHLGIDIAPQASGNVQLDPTGGAYVENEQVTLTAAAAAGWRFGAWSGDLVGSDNPATISMDANKRVTATFQSLDDFSLAVSVAPEEAGTVTLDPAGGAYADGARVTLTAVPADTYYACGTWTVDGQAVTNPDDPCSIGVSVDANKTISHAFTAKDSDADGICDKEEDDGPRGVDGNNDGTPDRTQANVASLKTTDGLNYFTLVAEAGTRLRQCRSALNPDQGNSPDWVSFPFGFFEFTIEGLLPDGATTLELILPTNLPESFKMPNSYYNYGPMPGSQGPQWYRFKYEQVLKVGAVFEEDVIRLHLIDNALGDDNSSEGVITDIGAPALVNNRSDAPSGGDGGSSGGGGSGGGGGGGCFVLTAGSRAR